MESGSVAPAWDGLLSSARRKKTTEAGNETTKM